MNKTTKTIVLSVLGILAILGLVLGFLFLKGSYDRKHLNEFGTAFNSQLYQAAASCERGLLLTADVQGTSTPYLRGGCAATSTTK